ncbi:nitroreductase family deazaflavin-dependent oxidoreductase [Nocardia transvalensis]|uniref:nitroreductase family deazaflavin-dependent oxidoreductase n=1 Tax=Nocardia transvalensis TaxID=37333 RepID=UPI001892D9BA|nr:nitroreductase family deazaflavin-dependent oxidoreductase [Nocardia transvalensis]MBF6331442.1 nitroreductase family deazaflavin-dependent oxidoreductase [Nocardia transvalensis]
MPKSRPALLDSAFARTLLKYGSRAQAWFYRRSSGRIGGTWRLGAGLRKPVPTLLLEHRGRKSGRIFTAPLLYLMSGSDIIIVASQGGMARHPQWYFNLLADPDTHVQIRAERRPVRARVATAQERDRLWPRLVELYADFDNYQSWTQRQIPVIVLSPR